MFDIVQWINIIFGILAIPIIASCLQELKVFVGVETTENGDVRMANVFRTLTIIFSTLALSYAGWLTGYVLLEWGGVEQFLNDRVDLLLLTIGFIAVGLFLVTRFMDDQIYKSIAKEHQMLELDVAEYKKRIRERNLIQQSYVNKTAMLNKSYIESQREADNLFKRNKEYSEEE